MKLRERENGKAFNVVVVHFNRGNANLRREQATNLRNWAAELPEPSIILGDFNFDLEVDDWAAGTLNGNRAYHIFSQSPSPFLWAQHAPMLKTLCNPEYNSVLDFIFLSGSARASQVETSLLFHDDPDYCPNERLGGADHFPIAASITFAGGSESGNPNAAVLEEIRRLRQQLDALESSLRAQ